MTASKMASEEELKSMILSFRVSELHMLLGFAGRNKSGRKLELQARAIELLKLNSYPVVLKIKNLYKSVQQNTHSNSGSANTGAQAAEGSEMGSTQSNATAQSPYRANNYSHRSAAQQRNNPDTANAPESCANEPNPNYPMHPDVRFQKIPFYDISAELLKPCSLVPQPSIRMQENTFIFHLTPQQCIAIKLAAETGAEGKIMFGLQAQLRICVTGLTCEQEDTIPPGFSLKINNRPCQLPEPVPSKLGVGPKRLLNPVNITPLMRIDPTAGNKIQIGWVNDYNDKRYAIAVYLVKKRTWEDLLNQMKAKGPSCADYTRGMIKDKLTEDADSEIATISLRVSLLCPIGKTRMVNPCRASTCQHLQCFDASLFLQMNEKKPSWTCPVCEKTAPYEKLRIDGYFQEVLASEKLSPDGNEIQLHADGSWSALSKKSLCIRNVEKDLLNPGANNSDDVQMEEVESGATEPSKVDPIDESTDNGKSGVKSVQEIDLTTLDSDDEPLIIEKTRLDSFFIEFEQFPGNAESGIDSPKGSPNVILLDSDSSSVSVSLPSPIPSSPASPN